jgi:hypothetical protein
MKTFDVRKSPAKKGFIPWSEWERVLTSVSEEEVFRLLQALGLNLDEVNPLLGEVTLRHCIEDMDVAVVEGSTKCIYSSERLDDSLHVARTT